MTRDDEGIPTVPGAQPDAPADPRQPERSADHPHRSFFGQPWSLVHVFGVEMWERFSFYGMQGILLLYLYFSVTDGGLGVPKGVAAGIVGAYGGAVYLSTIMGAWVADRLLGAERVLFYSAIVIMLGHVSLAVLPGFVGVGVGLILVAIGSGALKANSTSVVGSLYAPDDSRRDAGFSLFYLGINLGAFIGPLITGLLQSTLGFHIGFGAAAVGMALGLLQYSFGRRKLPDEARTVPNPLPRSRWMLVGAITLAGIAVIVVLALVGVIQAGNLAVIVIGVTIAATIAYFVVILSSHHIEAVERRRVYSFIPLFIASTAFWSLYQQQFTVITIYSDERLNRDLFGWIMPIPWVQSINPVFIIILSGVFTAIWTGWGKRQPSTPIKFAAGTALMGGAFLLFLFWAGGGANSTPLLGLVGILFVFTVAELLLSPVGLSIATKLAPRVFRTQMVALFFLSLALGTAISGELAKLYTAVPETVYFGILGGIAVGLGALLAIISPWVLKLMSGVR